MKLDLNSLMSKVDTKIEKSSETNNMETEQKRNSDIAIIGVACRIASSNDKEEYWNALKNGVDCIRPYPKKRQSYGNTFLKYQDTYEGEDGYYEGGFLDQVDQFDNEFFGISPVEADLMSPDQRNFLQVAWSALEDAGYGNEKIAKKKCGMFLGHSTDFGVSYKEFIDRLNKEMATYAISGNLHSIVSSRLSYILDLKGPSMNVDTACSSALVAIHTACKSLKNGDCNIAIAGATKIDNLPLKEIKKREDELGITSADGRTRTFDVNSDGTGLGEGVGAIVLKPLNAAIKDRDHVYAVIKGSAVNQDGKSANLTSPNPKAQEDVIMKAWQDAKINPEMVSYIEAHGTATKLGDPIEIQGITGAFSHYTNKRNFCGIGSVKSNIGHLDNAAGIAGIIKLILSLEHKEIPRSLHYTSSNEKIDFSTTPLYVNAKHREWVPNGDERICGISAFGLSGTNCHMVLGERKEQTRTVESNDSLKILSLSAKSKERLKEYIWKYQDYLFRNPNISLDDLCYTANTGRKQLEYRLAIVFQNREELHEKLQHAFLYPMETAMEKNIYFGEPESRKEVNVELTNSLLLKIQKGKVEDQLEAYQTVCQDYVAGIQMDWEKLYKDKDVQKISIPTYPFQPKSHWISVGANQTETVRKQEVVKEHPFVHELIVDSYDRVIYKSEFQVENDWILKEHLVNKEPTVPETTYIEMIYEIIRKHYQFDAVELSDLVFVNPLSLSKGGSCEVHMILKEDTRSFLVVSRTENEEEWNVHVEGNYDFTSSVSQSLDIKEIVERCPKDHLDTFAYEEGIGIETSNRWDCIRTTNANEKEIITYLTLREEYREENRELAIHPALLDEAVNVPLRTVGEGLYLPDSYERLTIYDSLPVELYSYVVKHDFEKDQKERAKYDILLTDKEGKVCIAIYGYSIKKVDLEQVKKKEELAKITHYKKQWEKRSERVGMPLPSYDRTVVFHKEDRISECIIRGLKEKGIILTETTDLERVAELFQGYQNCHLINLCPLSIHAQKDLEDVNVETLQKQLDEFIYPLVELLKSFLQQCPKTTIQMTTVGQFANVVTGDEPTISPWTASCLAFANALSLEHYKLSCRSIDMDAYTDISRIICEIIGAGNEKEVSYRNNYRYVSRIQELDKWKTKHFVPVLKEHGVYIISGGTGEVGLETALHLAKQKKITLVLLNSSELPSMETWKGVITQGTDKKLVEILEKLKFIEELGSQVFTYAVNMNDENSLHRVLEEVRMRYGEIRGVIHAAGVAEEGALTTRQREKIQAVLEPKMIGTLVLDKLTRQDNLDFFLVFSSVSAIAPEEGQLDYSAANIFLDAFAAYRRKMGQKALSVNWPAFEETGMEGDSQPDLSKKVFLPIKMKEAMVVLDWALNSDETNVIVGKINREEYDLRKKNHRISFELKAKKNKGLRKKKGNEGTKGEVLPTVELLGSENGYTNTERKLANVIGNALGLDSVDINHGFQKLGGNSIFAIKVQMDLENQGIEVTVPELLATTSLKEMAARFDGVELVQTEEKDKPEKLIEETQYGENAVVIKDVVPFTDIVYRGCFYSALIPAMKHYGRNINSLLFNVTVSYAFKQKEQERDAVKDFYVSYDDIKSLDDCLKKEGIWIERIPRSEHIIQDIEQSIDQGNPMIVSIDCYYEKLCKDCYQTEHSPHAILVYGYDKEQKIFYINEHEEFTSTLYQQLVIGYDELEDCYQHFFDEFEHLKIIESSVFHSIFDDDFTAPGTFIIHQENVVSDDFTKEYTEQFFDMYRSRSERLMNGLDNLTAFCEGVLAVMKDETVLKEQYNTLIEVLNDIISAKYLERYRYNQLDGYEEMKEELNALIKMWEDFRNPIVKYSFTHKYTTKLVEKVKNYVETIPQKEREYHEAVLKIAEIL